MARMDEYADTPGFCKSATLEKIRAEGHILAPGRYVDPEAAEIDSEPFEEKMQRLVAQLQVQTQRARIIDDTITSNLRELGFGGESLPDSWRWATLEEVASPKGRAIVSGPFGSNIGSRFFVESGVPVIRGGNLTIDLTRFVDSGFVFITDDKANQLRNCEAFPGDLIFTAAGSLGQVGIVPHSAQHSRYIISNKQLRARVDERIVDPLFAFYWFSSPRMVAYIQQRNTGSTIPLINLSVLRTLPIPLPPIAEQHAIARILGTLDDKIDLNRRVNQTLEEMARAIFRSWFVEFDPVRARSEGRRPVGMSEATAALFPDRFEESQIGQIPVGWKIKPIGETVKLVGGGTPSTKEPNFWDGGTHCWLVGSSRDRTGPD